MVQESFHHEMHTEPYKHIPVPKNQGKITVINTATGVGYLILRPNQILSGIV